MIYPNVNIKRMFNKEIIIGSVYLSLGVVWLEKKIDLNEILLIKNKFYRVDGRMGESLRYYIEEYHLNSIDFITED